MFSLDLGSQKGGHAIPPHLREVDSAQTKFIRRRAHLAWANADSPVTKGGTRPPLADAKRTTSNAFQPTAPRWARTTISAPPRYRAKRAYIVCDAQTNVPSAKASGANCVQRLDDSRDSAIHTKYRISLRSSS